MAYDVAKNPYFNKGVADYPPPQIDPRQKGYDWILAYCNAAYRDSKGYMINGVLNTGNLKMNEIKLYALGRQPVDKYKKLFSPGNPSNESWRAIDWTAPAFMCKYREIAISKLLQKKFDIQAFAIDPIARSEEDAIFNKMKVKILMREEAEKAGSPLANSPVLAPQPGEAEDLEQLAIQRNFGYKHAMAMEAENAINLIFERNNLPTELRKRLITSLYDYGIGALTQEIDENGMIRQRDINMEYFGCSYFEKPDASDLVHWFEVVPTYVGDLAPYYSKEQLDDICKKALNKFGNPNTYTPVSGSFNQAWNRFKVFVMKIKFLSWNDTVYKEEKDGKENLRFGKSSYKNKQFLSVNKEGKLEGEDENEYFPNPIPQSERGEQTPKYINSTKKVVYKASWVVDTCYMHDWGLQENQNRKLSSWWDTDLDIQLYAWNFYRMQFSGITERLIPLEDKASMIWFNLQNLANKLIPYLVNLDMNAIEGAGFGKAGEKMQPSEVVDFIFSNYIVPFRSTDLLSRNPNYKPVSIEATGQLAAFAQLYDDLKNTLDLMRHVSGLNEVTDASTVNERNINSTNAAMVESTNNAIFLLSEAEKSILLRTADAVIQKVQIAVQLGKVEGYAKALGGNTVKFFNINPNIALHELGVFIEDAPTDAQREALWQDVNIKESQGLLTVGDKYFIMTCRNLKEAHALLDYKIQKRKEELQQFELQKIQEAANSNMQIAATTEQMKQQSNEMMLDLDLIRINAEKQWEYEIEEMKKSFDLQGELVQAEGRNVGHEIQSKAKIIASHISAEAAKAKQEIANKKPKPKPKS